MYSTGTRLYALQRTIFATFHRGHQIRVVNLKGAVLLARDADTLFVPAIIAIQGSILHNQMPWSRRNDTLRCDFDL